MSDFKIDKVRNLIDKHPDEKFIVLYDLIKNLMKAQEPLCKLEISDSKANLMASIKLIIEHERLVLDFKKRLRGEIKNDVYNNLKDKPKRKGHKHPNSMKNLKYMQNK